MNPGITCPNCLSEIQEKSEFCSQWGHRLAAQKGGGIVWYWRVFWWLFAVRSRGCFSF